MTSGCATPTTRDTSLACRRKATVRGNFNGNSLFSASDGTFADSARVALWTKANSVSHFDDLIIKSLSEVSIVALCAT